jgi:hypothetical protein
MNFNQLAHVISENITSTIVASEEMEGARGRAANPEIEKLVSQGLPYWKARAMVRKGLTGAAEDKPVITSIKSKSDMVVLLLKKPKLKVQLMIT